MTAQVTRALFSGPVERVAMQLLGMELRVEGVGGRVVETEAYDAGDPASHSHGGPTPRNAAMFGPIGRVYVYRIYGLHWCFNIVCDAQRPGSAVLIRALEPLWGLDRMRSRRGQEDVRRLCAGPGRLCQALGIDGSCNGQDVLAPPFILAPGARPIEAVLYGPRIGIRRATETAWRFWEAESPYLSRPAPTTALTGPTA